MLFFFLLSFAGDDFNMKKKKLVEKKFIIYKYWKLIGYLFPFTERL